MPCEVFGRTGLSGGRRPYEVRVCGEARRVDVGAFAVAVRWGYGSEEELEQARPDAIVDSMDELCACLDRRAALTGGGQPGA